MNNGEITDNNNHHISQIRTQFVILTRHCLRYHIVCEFHCSSCYLRSVILSELMLNSLSILLSICDANSASLSP